jgi:hypothetical protein
MLRSEPVVSRQACRATLARVAPQLAHVRAERGFQRYRTTLGPTIDDLSEGVAMTPRGWIQMIAADFR